MYEVVTPFYIVSYYITYYIKWGNYFLDTRYRESGADTGMRPGGWARFLEAKLTRKFRINP